MSKPSIDSVKTRFAAYFRCNPAWGSLHVVLDDGNVDDRFVLFCLDYALQHEDDEGAALAEILLSMSKTQRLKLPMVIRRSDMNNGEGRS